MQRSLSTKACSAVLAALVAMQNPPTILGFAAIVAPADLERILLDVGLVKAVPVGPVPAVSGASPAAPPAALANAPMGHYQQLQLERINMLEAQRKALLQLPNGVVTLYYAGSTTCSAALRAHSNCRAAACTAKKDKSATQTVKGFYAAGSTDDRLVALPLVANNSFGVHLLNCIATCFMLIG
jgi:hypothetical protein